MRHWPLLCSDNQLIGEREGAGSFSLSRGPLVLMIADGAGGGNSPPPALTRTARSCPRSWAPSGAARRRLSNCAIRSHRPTIDFSVSHSDAGPRSSGGAINFHPLNWPAGLLEAPVSLRHTRGRPEGRLMGARAAALAPAGPTFPCLSHGRRALLSLVRGRPS